MKKVLFLLSIIFLITGCSITRLDDKKVENVINSIMQQNIKNTNAVGRGYKYYLPMGVIRQNIDNYNEKLYSLGDTYYLFIDVVGYLNNKEITSSNDSKAYYYKKLDNGYIYIYEKDDKYLIKCYLNYSFIESYVRKQNLNMALVNIMSMLKNVKFKKNILIYDTSDEKVSGYEETFSIKSKSKETVNFLDYEKQYDNYDSEIDIENNDDSNNIDNSNDDLVNDIITKDSLNK